MISLINHRINEIEQLAEVPLENGCEIDVRYHEDDLVLHHDPFGHHRLRPTRLADFLDQYRLQGPLILNVKTEGVEAACIRMMRERGIGNWFFLDLSMPMFAIFSERARTGEIAGFGPENLAVRFSEREPIEYALAFAGKAGWVWVDCFTRMPLDAESSARLKRAGFRICIVSPELQKHDTARIAEFRRQLRDQPFDAVCTKRPDLWVGPGAEDAQQEPVAR